MHKKTSRIFVYMYLCLAAAGCAPGINGMNQAITNTASVITIGYQTLGKVDAAVQMKIREQAKSDFNSASLALAEHLKRYEVAHKALDNAAAVVQIAVASVPMVKDGLSKNKNPASYIADLASVALAVTSALAQMGSP